MRRMLALVAVASVVMALTGPATPVRATPATNGRIVFEDFNDCNIYSINPDGTGELKLTNATGRHCPDFPSVSPDGTTILFTDLGGSEQRIFAMNADGTGRHQVAQDAPGFRDYVPRYSPDGSKIAFARCRPNGGDCAIWVMNADGTGMRPLTAYATGDVDFTPAWAPDGSHIAFTSNGRDGITSAVWVMNAADGSGKRRLTPAKVEAAQPAYSPDGSSIVAVTNSQELNNHIGAMNPDGTNGRALTHPPFPHNDLMAGYSPDGTKIVFVTDRAYPDGCCLDLYVMNADGTGLTEIPTGKTGVVFPSWGPATS